MTDNLFSNWLRGIAAFDISPGNAVIALAAAIVAYLAMSLLLRFSLSRLSRLAERTSTSVDDVVVEVLEGTHRALLALVALLIGMGILDLPDRWTSRVGQLWFLALALQATLWANRFITIALRRHAQRHASDAGATLGAAATLVAWGLRTLLWAIVILAMLSNVGVNITAFVASLGVGGIAIALAAQSVLGDLFASVAIAVDKPFEVGDFIVFGSVAGSVEVVGIKTTRIRSLGGEQVVMSNTELLKQTISNYKRLQERRILFGFGVTYDTSAEQAEAIPGLVRRVIEASDGVRFDRAHFKGFGASSLDYEVVYIVRDADYAVYMDQQQRINVGLMRELAALGIDFAFPTRTLHVVTDHREALRQP